MYELLQDNQVEMLSDAVYTILEKTGFTCENTTLLQTFEEGGAKVNYDNHIARFPKHTIRKFIDEVRKEDKSGWPDFMNPADKDTIYSGFHPPRPSAYFTPPHTPYMFHNLSTYFYDDSRNTRRPGNKQDFVHLIKIADTLHPQDGVGHMLNLTDAASSVEPLEAAKLLIQYSHIPRGAYVQDVRQYDYLNEIADIAGLQDPYFPWLANACPTPPLKLDRKAAERYVLMLKSGIYPAKIATMPIAGVNIPVTDGGAIALQAAEYIPLFLAARVLQPKKIPLTGMPFIGTMDLSTGNISFTAFDAAVKRLALCEFFHKWTDIPLSPGPGEFSPTKVPGLFTTLEKAHFSMTVAAFTGYHPDIGVGHLDAGLAVSPTQFLLDYEFTQSLSWLKKVEVDEESISLDEIIDAGFSSDYISREKTLNIMTKSTWLPAVWPRSGWSPEEEEKSKQKCHAKIQRLLNDYKPPEGREELLPKIDAIIKKAKEAITGGA